MRIQLLSQNWWMKIATPRLPIYRPSSKPHAQLVWNRYQKYGPFSDLKNIFKSGIGLDLGLVLLLITLKKFTFNRISL